MTAKKNNNRKDHSNDEKNTLCLNRFAILFRHILQTGRQKSTALMKRAGYLSASGGKGGACHNITQKNRN